MVLNEPWPTCDDAASSATPFVDWHYYALSMTSFSLCHQHFLYCLLFVAGLSTDDKSDSSHWWLYTLIANTFEDIWENVVLLLEKKNIVLHMWSLLHWSLSVLKTALKSKTGSLRRILGFQLGFPKLLFRSCLFEKNYS